MFTGIIEGQGKVVSVRPGAQGGKVLQVAHELAGGEGQAPVGLGDSVAHNGVCLTAVNVQLGRYDLDVGPETLSRTNIGEARVGHKLNLERSLTLSSRLGGHMVQGHVDEVGRVRSVVSRDNAQDIWIDVSSEVLPLIIPRGSVAVDGISLTVTGRDERGFSLSIIPHTWEVTSLRDRGPGSGVNIEVDLLARYVEGLLQGRAGATASGLSYERFEELWSSRG